MRYNTSYTWESGSRPINEDSMQIFSFIHNHRPVLLAVVADGIGGASRGEDASSMLVSHLRNSLEQYSLRVSRLTLRNLQKLLIKELYLIHDRLKNIGEANHITIGTTCSLVILLGRKGIIIHVGDSRIYLGSRLLTSDHIDDRGHLTSCIGIGTLKKPYIRRIRMNQHSPLLLCTDGFYKPNSTDNRTSILINLTGGTYHDREYAN